MELRVKEMYDPLDAALGDIVKLKPEVTYNNNRTYPNGAKAPDGIEIRFGTNRPTAEVREMLKAHGFKFSEKQTMWYALDNTKSRELAQHLTENEIDVDDTQYEKRSFWVRLKSVDEFDKLFERTEFFVKSDPPKFFHSKSFLRKAYPSINALIYKPGISYRRFYNKVVGDEGEPNTNQPQQAASNYNPDEVSEKLVKAATAMQKQVEAKLNPAISKQRPTQKRLRIAASMRSEAYELQKVQATLLVLAQAHRTGTIDHYPLLKQVRSRSHAELILRFTGKSDFEFYKADLSKIGIENSGSWELAAKQVVELVNSYSPSLNKENEDAERIKELEIEVLGRNIPGFFPTPPELVEQLIELADLYASDRVLEPSAGKGDILDAIKEYDQYRELHALEVNSTLREILSLKNYTLVGDDFLEYNPEEKYNKIIMNPPFEGGQDIDHLIHAFSLLEPDGRVVAIINEGPFFRQFKKDKAFREFLQENNAFVSAPIKDAFKKSFNTTSVNVRIVAINKDGSTVNSQAPSQANASDDFELLEVEAEAELELLKMRVELERKKNKQVGGIGGIDTNKLEEFKRKAWQMQERWEVLNYK